MRNRMQVLLNTMGAEHQVAESWYKDNRKDKAMTKYTARFTDGHEIIKTDKDFKSRVEFYKWICSQQLGKKHGQILEIVMTAYIH